MVTAPQSQDLPKPPPQARPFTRSPVQNFVQWHPPPPAPPTSICQAAAPRLSLSRPRPLAHLQLGSLQIAGLFLLNLGACCSWAINKLPGRRLGGRL